MHAEKSLPAKSVQESWAGIKRLTDAMRQAAAKEAWSEVVELAGSRHHSLLAHFARFPVGPDTAVFYQDELTSMLHGEQELQAIAVDARRQVMRLSASARQSQRAVGAYLAPRR